MVCRYRYFTEVHDPKMVGLDAELLATADMARHFSRVPYIITSGLRTKEANSKLPDAVLDSAHLTGHAMDLFCDDSATRFAIINGLRQAGFVRIGIGPNFIHVDIDPTKPPEVFFTYSSTKGAPADWKLKGC